MNLTKSDQLLIGLNLSVAVALGIMVQSASLAFATLVVGAFFFTPALVLRGLVTTRRNIRHLAWAVAFVWSAVFAGGMLATIERLYYVNGDGYPRWLASGELTSASQFDALREGDCKGRGFLEISEKADGLFVVRCGIMWWESKTYLASFNPSGGAQ